MMAFDDIPVYVFVVLLLLILMTLYNIGLLLRWFI